MMILLQKWEDPEEGTVARLLDLSDADLAAVREDIAWLEEHAAEELGGALSEWILADFPSRSTEKRVREQNKDVYHDLAAVRAMMVLESRYEEDPTFYGDQPYPPYAAIAGKPHWR